MARVDANKGVGVDVAKGVGHGSGHRHGGYGGAHTDGTDAHVKREDSYSCSSQESSGMVGTDSQMVDSGADGEEAMGMGMQMDVDVDSEAAKEKEEKERERRRKERARAKLLRANTINFAQREKDEMRDLTRASEILTVPSIPSPSPFGVPGGQMYGHGHGHGDVAGIGGGGGWGAASPSVASIKASPSAMEDGVRPWNGALGQVFLGNSNDVPLSEEFLEAEARVGGANGSVSTLPNPNVAAATNTNGTNMTNASTTNASTTNKNNTNGNAVNGGKKVAQRLDPFDFSDNDPDGGFGYDICIECHDRAPQPQAAHLRAAEDHLRALDAAWVERCQAEARASSAAGTSGGEGVEGGNEGVGEQTWNERGEWTGRVRPPPSANAVVHLPFPSSPLSPNAAVAALFSFLEFLERVLMGASVTSSGFGYGFGVGAGGSPGGMHGYGAGGGSPRQGAFGSSPGMHAGMGMGVGQGARKGLTRPAKVLIYSSDGYTESSVLALCLLMAMRGMSLPQAYLELQVRFSRLVVFRAFVSPRF